jgi:hypothetical protein
MKSNQLYFFPLYQNFKTRKNCGKRKKVFFYFERFAADLLRLRAQTADPGQK